MGGTFRTKTGTCTVTDDKIVLAREGARGAMAEAQIGSSMARVRITYALLAIVALGGGIAMVAVDESVGYVSIVLGVVIAYSLVRTIGLSATPEIARAAITKIEAFPPREMVTRGHFVVHFVEDGKPRKRIIITREGPDYADGLRALGIAA